MKISVRIVQIIVAALFIFSGLIKANDPPGLSYKMQEFFELWNIGLAESHFFAKNVLIHFFDFLHDHSLFLSVTMITLEVTAGVALLLGWMKKFILYILLVLIIFFTFLTGYAYLSGKFTNCGCFGDCLPIKPFTSFAKDLSLLAMIIYLIIGQKYIQPFSSKKFRTVILTTSLVLCLLLQWYVLNYLPLADCLPFKKGNSIAEQMQSKPNELPAIMGFSLLGMTTGIDSTNIILNQSKTILLFVQDFSTEEYWVEDFRNLKTKAVQKNIGVYAVTSDPQTIMNEFVKNKIGIQVFSSDFTLIRTAARTNPTLYFLKKGIVFKKYSYRKINDVETDLLKF